MDAIVERTKFHQDGYDSSLGRCIGLTNDTVQVSEKIMENLHQQGEQLERIDRQGRNIGQTVHRTENVIAGMRSWFFPCLYRKSKFKLKNLPSTQHQPPTQHQPSTQHQPLTQPPKQPATSVAVAVSDDPNLKILGDNIGKIKHAAQIIGDELDRQNELIDVITLNSDVISGRISSATADMRRIS